MSALITTLGPWMADMLGMILPHEHIFVDLRQDNPPDFAQAEPASVIALMGPEIEKAAHARITALVECTPVGVGRRADLLKAVSEATQFPIVVPTGIYREPWIPAWALNASEDVLYEWMLGELTDQITYNFNHNDVKSGVQAAWIKLSAGDDGITPAEAKILRAAARAGVETGAVIGSHTIRGRVVHDQLDIIQATGYRADRYIWIHAQSDTYDRNLEVAQRGAWIEYDGIGNPDWVTDDEYIERIQRLLDAGYGEQIMLSHDRGWYDPGQPNGGIPKPFTYLVETFLPKLRAAGIDDATIQQLTQTNPFNAFAR
jgi:phosphotriesterase-related protein